MKKPTELKMMGFDFALFFPTDISDKHLGTWSYQKQGIIIDGRLTDTVQQATLLHEIIHACSYLSGAFIKERQVHAIAAQLFVTLRENPEVAKWLLAKIKE